MCSHLPAFIIADAHDVCRCGMSAFIKQHFKYAAVTEVTDCNSLLAAVDEHWYDVVLIDVSLPSNNGFDAAKQVYRLNSNYRIMLYGFEQNEQVLMRAFSSGAAAFLYSLEKGENIINSIEAVLKNGYCVTAESFVAYRRAHNNMGTNPEQKALTIREKEVLQLIQKGYTSRQMAAELHLSPKTVENHRNRLLNKTGRHNTAQLLLYAQETGM